MTEPDVIVVGSGPTGAMAAATLVGRGLDVLLLDAGQHVPGGVVVRAAGNTLYRRMAWADYANDRLDASSSPDVDWYSSRSLGGLSNYWTAAVPRFAPEDFTDGGRLDERYRWPVSYDDLVPYYERAERRLVITAGNAIHGVPGNVGTYEHPLSADWRGLADAATQAGHGMGTMPLAKGRPWMIARRGTEFNSYHCIVEPLTRERTFRLQCGAAVVRLNWSAPAGRIESVDYIDRASGALRTARARAFVIAAGVVDTTALLMRSRSADFPTGLGNTHDLLGRYLHDHPKSWWIARSTRPLRALAHPVYIARRPHIDSCPLMATSLTLGLSGTAQRLRTFYGGKTSSFGVQVFGTIIPKPDRSLALADDDQPLDADVRPRLTLRFDAATLSVMNAARDRLREVFGAGGVGIGLPEPVTELRPGASVHLGGSVRMHADPTFGVLDGFNRMHDARNVAVVDSSAFTTGPEKNPTLTAMALSARAADRLADDLGCGVM